MSVYLGKDSVNVAMFARMQNEGKYTTRTTAGGEEILDGKLASVKKIQGDTAKPTGTATNLFYTVGNYTSYEGVTISYNKETQEYTFDGTTNSAGNVVLSTPLKIPNLTADKYYTVVRIKTGGTVTFPTGANMLWSLFNKANLNEYGTNRLYENSTTANTTMIAQATKLPVCDGFNVYLQMLNNSVGTVFNNFKFKLQIIEGEYTANNLPAIAGFADLKHVFFDSIKSTGRNIVNFDEIALNAVKKSTNSEIVTFDGKRCLKFMDTGNASIPTILPSGVIHGLRFKVYVDGEWFTSFASYKLSNETTQYLGISASDGNKWVEFSRYFNDSRTIESFTFYAYNYQNNAPIYIDLDSVMFEQSGTPTEYDAYKESIYKLPSPVELCKWNYIDVQGKTMYRQTKIYVFDGTENWGAVGVWTNEKKRFYLNVNEKLENKTNMHAIPELVCNYYDTVSPADCYGSQSAGIATGASMQSGSTLLIYDEVYNAGDLAVWKSHLAELYASGKPLTIAVKLETAMTEDLGEIPETYTAWNGGTETIEQGETDNSVYGAMPTITATYLKEYFNGGIQ